MWVKGHAGTSDLGEAVLAPVVVVEDDVAVRVTAAGAEETWAAHIHMRETRNIRPTPPTYQHVRSFNRR